MQNATTLPMNIYDEKNNIDEMKKIMNTLTLVYNLDESN